MSPQSRGCLQEESGHSSLSACQDEAFRQPRENNTVPGSHGAVISSFLAVAVRMWAGAFLVV